MRRVIALFAVAVMLVLVAWSAGRAQARAANFYMTVDAPAGEVKTASSRNALEAANGFLAAAAEDALRIMRTVDGKRVNFPVTTQTVMLAGDLLVVPTKR